MKQVLLSILLFYSFVCFSQLIDNSNCNAFSDDPFFNSAFVRTNKIKALRGSISTKKELGVIKNSDLVMNFEFDKKGNLIMQYHSYKKKNKRDTTFIHYIYSDAGDLITKRTNDPHGFYSYNYEYNKDAQIVKKTYCRDHNSGKSRSRFVLEKQFVIINEAYSYKKKDTLLIKTVYNNNGLAYQINTSVYNSLNYLTEERKKLLINNKKSLIKYGYDEHGLLKSKKIYRDINDSTHNKTLFFYDELGNLTYIDEYKNGKHITHKELLYDRSTMTLKTLIIQDVEINFIKIIKFKPVFHAPY